MSDRSALMEVLQTISREMLDLTPVLPEFGEIMMSSIRRNFATGGRFGDGRFGGGSERWKMSKRAAKQNGQTLLDTGQLAASLSYSVQGDTLFIGSNKKYAAVHNFGGAAGRGHKALLTARPFIVIQDEDLTEMQRAVLANLSKRLSGR